MGAISSSPIPSRCCRAYASIRSMGSRISQSVRATVRPGHKLKSRQLAAALLRRCSAPTGGYVIVDSAVGAIATRSAQLSPRNFRALAALSLTR
jgi:hypothetical protein